jgi:restriction endonuclease S subunit
MSEWADTDIGEHADIVLGGTPSTQIAKYWGGEIRWMSSGDVNGRFVDDVPGRITVDGLRSSNATLVEPPAVAVALAGQGKTRGTAALVRTELSTNQSVALLKGRVGQLHTGFLFHNLDARYEELRRSSSGGGRGGLSKKILSSLPLHLPPIDEQRHIAEILDTADEAIRFTERLIAKLAWARAGLLGDVVSRYFPGTGLIRERAKASPRSLPPLRELVDSGEVVLGRGEVISALDIGAEPGPYPIYSSSGAGRGEFGRYGGYMFDEELITWSIDGGGRPFLRPKHRFSVTNVGGYLRVYDRNRWSYPFVHAMLEYQHGELTFDWLTKAHPSVVKDLYFLPRCSIEEQRAALEGVQSSEASLLALESDLLKEHKVRAGLAAELLSGRVRTVAS